MRRILFVTALAVLASCERYDSPPLPEIDGAKDGVLSDNTAPLRIRFSEPVKEDTVKVKVGAYNPDPEGNLADEQGDPDKKLATLYWLRDPDFNELEFGGTSRFIEGGHVLEITPKARFPIGPKLVAVVEPGVQDLGGVATRERKKLLFSYEFKCSGTKGTQLLKSGTYYFLLKIEVPLTIQVQLYGVLAVDPVTGKFKGQFTNADRDKALRCPTPCDATQVCRKLPGPPVCVAPSEQAATVDEYPDFVPNSGGATGYTFAVSGCAEDQPDGTVALNTAPGNMVAPSPRVEVNAFVVNGSFALDPSSVLRGTGSMSSDQIIIGTSPSGSGRGTFAARLVPAEQVPPGIPAPTP